MVRQRIGRSVTALLVLAAVPGRLRAAPDLAVSSQPVSESDLSLSRRIPVKGNEIELRARVRNLGDEAVHDIDVVFAVTDPGGTTAEVGSRRVSVDGGKSTLAAVKYTPGRNGFFKFSVRVDSDNKVSEADEGNNATSWDFPVVYRRLYFNKWGSDIKDLRYLNMSAVGYYTPDKEFKPTEKDRSPPVTWKDVRGVRVPLQAAASDVRLDRRIVEAKWTPMAADHYRIEIEIAPSTQYTLLDAYAEKGLVVTGPP